jgi:hypothetical protein
MKIRLYCDEDAMDSDLIEALTIRGLDVTTANIEGMINRLDPEHLALAVSQQRVLYSFNVGDYQRLHIEYLMQNKIHSGIILAQQQRFSVGEQMRRLLRIAAAKSAEEMQNSVEFLSNWG